MMKIRILKLRNQLEKGLLQFEGSFVNGDTSKTEFITL